MRENCIGSGNSNVSRESEIKPAADAIAANRRDNRLRESLDSIRRRLPEIRKRARVRSSERGNFFEIGANAESGFAARNHHAVATWRGFERIERFEQRAQHAAGKARQPARMLQR